MTDTRKTCPCKELIDLKIELGGHKDMIKRLQDKLEVAITLLNHLRETMEKQ